MRILGEIKHPDCKITLFSWNNRYLIKFEDGLLEQTFKIDQFDLESENDLTKVVSEAFIQDAVSRFHAMHTSLRTAVESIQ